jgi:L-cysteine desulfidase
MEKTEYHNHIAILQEELVCALGCTEPIAVAYAAALARTTLGAMPDHILMSCSGNIIKNVKSATVPNSGGLRGIEAAAVLGAVGGDETRALEVLEGVTPDDIERTKGLLGEGICEVELAQDVPNLYVQASAWANGHEARVRIEDRHTHVSRVELDGHALPCPSEPTAAKDPDAKTAVTDRSAISVESIWRFAHELDPDDVRDVLDRQLELNRAISDEGLAHPWGARIGATLIATRPDDVTCRARATAAAGSDARMSGCSMPVVINSGSGNQGLTCTMPVATYAEGLGSSHDDLLRALAISNLVSVHVKHFIGSLSAFCGAVSAASGAAAAICFLRGGTLGQAEASVANTLANVGGIVCDGAKPSCAAKISAAVDAAILGCDMALADHDFKAGDGLVGSDVEQTIRSMGYVGRVGMHPTDVEILNIMIGKTDCGD